MVFYRRDGKRWARDRAAKVAWCAYMHTYICLRSYLTYQSRVVSPSPCLPSRRCILTSSRQNRCWPGLAFWIGWRRLASWSMWETLSCFVIACRSLFSCSFTIFFWMHLCYVLLGNREINVRVAWNQQPGHGGDSFDFECASAVMHA